MSKVTATKELIGVLAHLASEVIAIADDGKVSYTDVVHVITGMKDLAAIVGMDFKVINEELKQDLTDEDEKEIEGVMHENFDLEDDAVELLVENLLDELVHFMLSSEGVLKASLALKGHIKK